MTTFTVIIATCDRPGRLERALDAIKAAVLAAGGEHRLVIVDNGTRLPAKEVVERFSRQVGFHVTHLTSEPYNKSAALNAGIRAADTEWLAFTDDDCLSDPEWLKEGARYAETARVNVFGGKVAAGAPDFLLPRWLVAGRSGKRPGGPTFVEYAPLARSGTLEARSQVPLGANVFVHRGTFDKHGGYDEALWRRCGKAALGCEDGEFGIRLQKAREPIGYCAEAVVVHPAYSERATLRQHIRAAYFHGIREQLLPGAGPCPVLFLLRRGVVCLFRGIMCLAGKDPAACVWELQRSAISLGQVIARFRGESFFFLSSVI